MKKLIISIAVVLALLAPSFVSASSIFLPEPVVVQAADKKKDNKKKKKEKTIGDAIKDGASKAWKSISDGASKFWKEATKKPDKNKKSQAKDAFLEDPTSKSYKNASKRGTSDAKKANAEKKKKKDKKKDSKKENKNATTNSANKKADNKADAKVSTDSVDTGSGTENNEEEGESKAKKTAKYSGGTDQKVNTDPVVREYVADPRRSATDPIRFLSDDPTTKSLMEEVTAKVNKAVEGKNLLVYSTDGMFSFSSNIYRVLNDDDKKKIMSYSLKTIKESELPDRVKTKATNFIKEQDPKLATVIEALNSDTSSELSEGYAWFIPFSTPVSWVLGVMATLVLMFIIIRSTIDFAYFGSGLVRAFLEIGDGKPKFVSSEAWQTVREVDGGMMSGEYRDYLPVYFSKVIPITVFSVVLVAWLSSGEIYNLFSWFMEIIEGLKDAMFQR